MIVFLIQYFVSDYENTKYGVKYSYKAVTIGKATTQEWDVCLQCVGCRVTASKHC